jgi:hypothetical protein
MRHLARSDARHLLRSPLLRLGVGLAAWICWLRMATALPLLPGDDQVLYESALAVGGGAFLAGAWLGLRDERHRVAEVLAVTPTAPARLWYARLSAVAVAGAGVFLLLFVVGLGVSTARGGGGSADARLALDGALGVLLSGSLGMVVGRFTRSRLLCVLAAPLWVASSFFLGFGATFAPDPAVVRLAPILAGQQRSAVLGFLPDLFWGHLAYLGGVVALIALCPAVVLRRGAEPRTWTPPLVALLLAAALLAGGGAAWLLRQPDALRVTGPDPATWQPAGAGEPITTEQDAAGGYPQDGLATACAQGTVRVCVYPAYGQRWAQALLGDIEPAAQLLAGLPGVPDRVRVVPDTQAPCQGREAQLSEHDLATYQRHVSPLGSQTFLGCALAPPGPLHPDEAGGSGALFVVWDWALAVTDEEYRRGLLAGDAAFAYAGAVQIEAVQGMLALPPEQVRRELEPVWDRVRADTLPLEELPGAS